MPIYEYTCQDCSDQFELFLQGSQTPKCPHCCSQNLEKKFSVFAVSGNSTTYAMKEPPGL